MPATYNILIMGASYGSLLASKLLFGGHQVKLVCLPQEADLINAEGFRVRLPIRGRKDPVEIDSRKLPGKVSAGGPADVDPTEYDLVGLAMQEPQYTNHTIRVLMVKIAAAKLPALFHTGQTAVGQGAPGGGGGIRLKYGNPIYLDDVAVDFPDMPIIMAHPSFPWQDEALAIAQHKRQVFIDLSGWSPKYFPPQLVQYANTQLRSKVLFGSDFPLITPDRWLADFEQAPFKEEVRPLILKENAAKLLDLR